MFRQTDVKRCRNYPVVITGPIHFNNVVIMNNRWTKNNVVGRSRVEKEWPRGGSIERTFGGNDELWNVPLNEISTDQMNQFDLLRSQHNNPQASFDYPVTSPSNVRFQSLQRLERITGTETEWTDRRLTDEQTGFFQRGPQRLSELAPEGVMNYRSNISCTAYGSSVNGHRSKSKRRQTWNGAEISSKRSRNHWKSGRKRMNALLETENVRRNLLNGSKSEGENEMPSTQQSFGQRLHNNRITEDDSPNRRRYNSIEDVQFDEQQDQRTNNVQQSPGTRLQLIRSSSNLDVGQDERSVEEIRASRVSSMATTIESVSQVALPAVVAHAPALFPNTLPATRVRKRSKYLSVNWKNPIYEYIEYS